MLLASVEVLHAELKRHCHDVQGQYQDKPKLPFVPGSEVSGVVTAVGSRVHSVRPGDHVRKPSQQICISPRQHGLQIVQTTDLHSVPLGSRSLLWPSEDDHVPRGRCVL